MSIKAFVVCGILLAGLSLLKVAADDRAGMAGLSATATESYQIRNAKFGELLRPKDANSANGTRIVLYPAEPWKCMTWKLHPAGDDVFCLQNHFTSKTFQAKADADNRRVVQIPFASDMKERPRWHFTRLADGLYQISDDKTGESLTAADEAGNPVVTTAKWEDKPEQKWKLEKIDPASLTM